MTTSAPLSITRAEWEATHRDFKGRLNGHPYVLRNDPATGGTIIQPVTIVADAMPDVLQDAFAEFPTA